MLEKEEKMKRIHRQRMALRGVPGSEERRKKLLRQAGRLAVEINEEKKQQAAQPPSRTAQQDKKMQTRLTVTNRACLVNAPREISKKIQDALTLSNPAFEQAKAHGRYFQHLPPTIQLWSKTDDGLLYFPRGFAAHALAILREHGVKPEIQDQRRTLEPVDFSFSGELRDYQQAAVTDVLKRDFGVLGAATGSGKTVMALATIAARRQPALIIVHSKELQNQWAERIRAFLGIEPGLIGDGKYDVQSVSVAIVNTACKHLDSLPEHFGHIVVDECHRTPSSMFTEAVQAFDSKFMLGLSATAYRRDGLTKLIYFTLGQKVHSVNSKMLNSTGAVLQPKVFASITDFRYNYQEDYSKMLTTLTQDGKRNNQIAMNVTKIKNDYPGTVLVVSDRVAHCQALADLIQDSGLKVQVLTGQCSKQEREQIVSKVQAGQVNVLCSTVQLLGEGFDCSGLSTLFLGTPIKFKGKLLQVVGRILRPKDGKRPVVFDYVDHNVGVLKAQAKSREKALQEIAA